MGSRHSKETRAKMSAAQRVFWSAEENRKKKSASQKALWTPEKRRAQSDLFKTGAVVNGMTGRKHSKKSIKLMSDAAKKRKISPVGKKLSLAEGAVGILVVQLRFGVHHVIVNGLPADECYETMEAAKQAGVDLARRIMQHAAYQLDLLKMREEP